MTDHLMHPALHMPLLRRLGRWLGASPSVGRARSSGGDTARMDLGYEAAYAPVKSDISGPPSRFEEDRSAA